MRLIDLDWLAPEPQFGELLRAASALATPPWHDLVRLANSRLDFLRTTKLDKALSKNVRSETSDAAPWRRLKLAILSSSTADHLLPGLRIAGLRRNLLIDTYVGDYGLYWQELEDTASALHTYSPDVVLLSMHAQHLFGSPNPTLQGADAQAVLDAALDRLRQVWRLARRLTSGQIIQQTVLPVFKPLLGQNEVRLPGSGASLVLRLNRRIAEMATEEGVDVLSLDDAICADGLRAWHDPVLWLRAKQEISPLAAPAYGEFALRLIGAQQGRSAKCLVLDLDNTLWGGVIGDDGLEGIKLGQGSALGEAYVEFQSYVKDLARRGVILAVCSKNDIENAKLPFERHPDMILKMEDIACFVANWSDKASNIRQIAEQLNIGIDSLVFVDDNPFERNIVRRELPMVAVPELPEDPAFYSQMIADAAYFEALAVTAEDFERGGQYRANAARESLRASHTDLEGYLKSLNMELRWQPFDNVGLQRIVQLINKTNQFNLTTRRYTESEVLAIMGRPGTLTLQLRLLDQFGDNGIIGIVVGTLQGTVMTLDTWLMSCRVLGRQVEQATMNLVAREAALLGATELLGIYIPSKKNAMVKDHYLKLGFAPSESSPENERHWRLVLGDYKPFEIIMNTTRSNT